MVLSSAIVCDHDRRIADDRRSSFHMIADDRRPYCDLRSAICDPRSYGNQPLLDRTWFYHLRSRSQDRRRSQTLLRSAIIWKPALTLIFACLCFNNNNNIYNNSNKNRKKISHQVKSLELDLSLIAKNIFGS